MEFKDEEVLTAFFKVSATNLLNVLGKHIIAYALIADRSTFKNIHSIAFS